MKKFLIWIYVYSYFFGCCQNFGKKWKKAPPFFKFLCWPFQLGVVYLREFLLKYSCISLKIPCYDFSNDESDFLSNGFYLKKHYYWNLNLIFLMICKNISVEILINTTTSWNGLHKNLPFYFPYRQLWEAVLSALNLGELGLGSEPSTQLTSKVVLYPGVNKLWVQRSTHNKH